MSGVEKYSIIARHHSSPVAFNNHVFYIRSTNMVVYFS